MQKGRFRGENAAIRAISGGQIAGDFHSTSPFSKPSKQARQTSKTHVHRCICGSFHRPARMKSPMPPLKRRASAPHSSAMTPPKNRKSAMQFSENQAVNRSNPAPISRGLAIVKGGSLGAVAEAISPLTITSPQAS